VINYLSPGAGFLPSTVWACFREKTPGHLETSSNLEVLSFKLGRIPTGSAASQYSGPLLVEKMNLFPSQYVFFLSFLLRPAGQRFCPAMIVLNGAINGPYKWVTGPITLRIWGSRSPLATSRCPPCGENVTIDDLKLRI